MSVYFAKEEKVDVLYYLVRENVYQCSKCKIQISTQMFKEMGLYKKAKTPKAEEVKQAIDKSLQIFNVHGDLSQDEVVDIVKSHKSCSIPVGWESRFGECPGILRKSSVSDPFPCDARFEKIEKIY